MTKKTQQRPPGVFSGRLYGSFAGKPPESDHPVGVLTQQRPPGVFGGRRYGSFAGKTGGGPSAPTSVVGTPTGGTTATITWVDAGSGETGFQVQLAPVSTGTFADASGATNPTAANVQTFAATTLTANTEYTPRVRALGSPDSAWAAGSTFWTDNTGGGGGDLAVTLDATGGSGTLSAVASITSNAALAATGGSGTLSAIATTTAYVTMAATGGSGTFAATAYTPATASLAATGGSGTLRAVASGVLSGDDLRGSPPGLNFDADEDDYLEDLQTLMAIAAAAFELEMV